MTETLPARDGVDVAAEARRIRTVELLDELARAGGAERDVLLTQLTRLYADVVEQIARRYRGRGVEHDVLCQVGYVGLMKAINGYRVERGDLLPYAVTTISGEVKRHFRDRCWDIRPIRRIQELELRLAQARADLAQELGREPTVAETADRLGEDPDDVRTAAASYSLYNVMSTDAATRREAGHDSDALTLGESVGGDDGGYERAEIRSLLGDAMSCLTERERRILGLRFYRDMTQREIAEEIGVTQMQVSRILTRTIARLRDQLGALD